MGTSVRMVCPQMCAPVAAIFTVGPVVMLKVMSARLVLGSYSADTSLTFPAT